MNTLNLKQRIISELKNPLFPDLWLIFSKEALDLANEILFWLLEEEKTEFENLLKTKKSDINFDIFESDGILDYYWSLLNHFQWVNNTKKIRNIIEKFRPKLEDFSNYVSYNKDYFYMLVYCQENCDLDEEQKRVLFLRIKSFKERWIDLDEKKQKRLKILNKKLSKLSNDFSNNVVDDQSLFEYVIKDFEQIKDLPEDVLELAKKQAEEKGKDWYLFTSDPTAYISIMKYCTDSNIRKDFYQAHFNFCSSWKYDNRNIIIEILKYKKEKANLLWYKNYAELSLNDKMADSPNQVLELLESISKKAKSKAKKEIQELKDYFWTKNLEIYDFSFYSTKYKKEKYDIDDKVLKQYFECNNVIRFLHKLAETFFWVVLKKLDIESYDIDVEVYEVYREWKLISYYFMDLFYRKEKRQWAWADIIRERNYEIMQKWIKNKIPLVVNCANFQKWINKTLLTIRDVETIFHEFWHALHAMLAESKYSELNWFEVEWDFVELPSQLLENWVIDKESLSKLAIHHETWVSIEEELINKLEKLKIYMTWNFVVSQNEYALLDLNLHMIENIPDSSLELDKICLDLIKKYSLFDKEESYKMYCSFSHIFWWWYAAWYYSYMWAEIIEAQVFDKIKKEWMFNKEVWKKYIDSILWPWTKKPAKELFYDFVKSDLDINYFYKRKGL